MLSPPFWAAFWAGLAAPVGLYAPPTPYLAYINTLSLPQTFDTVGWYLSRAAAQVGDVRQPSATAAT